MKKKRDLDVNWNKRCKYCKWLEIKCMECNMRYSEFEHV